LPPATRHTLSLHAALPISAAPEPGEAGILGVEALDERAALGAVGEELRPALDDHAADVAAAGPGLSWGNRPHFGADQPRRDRPGDRKSTRLNSSHQIISYA